MKERTVIRSIGCYSCIHWENGELAKTRFQLMTGLPPGMKLEQLAQNDCAKDPMLKSKVEALVKEGFSIQEAAAGLWGSKYRELQDKYGMADKIGQLVAAGQAGYCTVNAEGADGQKADFTHMTNLCGNNTGSVCRWQGKDGASIAIAGQPLAPLFDEHTDLIDHKARHRDVGSTATLAKPVEIPAGDRSKMPAPTRHTDWDPDRYKP